MALIICINHCYLDYTASNQKQVYNKADFANERQPRFDNKKFDRKVLKRHQNDWKMVDGIPSN